MKVLVCFKAVPELEALTGSDWRPGPRFQIETRFVKTVINPLDESALELALKLRDQGVQTCRDVSLTAVTIGDAGAEAIIKTLNALKFTRAVRIDSAADLRFNAEEAAAQLAAFIRAAGDFDCVAMGGRSADGDNARTPLLLAEALGRPCLTQVTAFRLQGNERLEVTSLSDDGERVQVVKPPLVLAVGNAPAAYLRVPTLKDRLAHGKQEAETVSASVVSARPSYEITALKYEQHEREAVIIEGSGPAAKAARLYDEYLKGRL